MKEIIDKISSYNLFNYLLPGVLFVTVLDKFTNYSFIQENLVIGIFVYYFIGLVISRVGSLVIEPVLRKVSFLKFANYSDFVSASKKDSKIEVFLKTNNMYRTFSSMLILLLLLKLYEFVELAFPILARYNLYILLVFLLIIFLYSYRKQTKYIIDRIKANNE